jgi:hypothetical protein
MVGNINFICLFNMVKNKTSRMQKIQWLMETIKAAIKQKKIIDVDKLVGEFCLAMNSTPRTCVEMLNIFEDTKRITIKKLGIKDRGQIISCNFGK